MIDNKEYAAMVQELKSKKVDYECLDMDLVHGIIGINTEAVELMESPDAVNIVEECGDVIWYVQLVLASCGSSITKVLEDSVDITKNTEICIDDIVIEASKLLDILKRAFYYGKGAEGVDFEAILKGCSTILSRLHCILVYHNSRLTVAMDKNYRKLMLKRYPNGFDESSAWNRDTDAEREELEK